MHRVIGDKATPKTGGVTNRVHAKAASSFEFHISNFGFVSDFDIRILDFPPAIELLLFRQDPIE
jgi:hypothetical protein